MSGDHVGKTPHGWQIVSGDQLNTDLGLDVIAERAAAAGRSMWAPHVQQVANEDVPALIAEVRRLRTLLDGSEVSS